MYIIADIAIPGDSRVHKKENRKISGSEEGNQKNVECKKCRCSTGCSRGFCKYY